jgi:hypothetical protein
LICFDCRSDFATLMFERMDAAYLNILAILVTSDPMMTVELCTSMIYRAIGYLIFVPGRFL